MKLNKLEEQLRKLFPFRNIAVTINKQGGCIEIWSKKNVTYKCKDWKINDNENIDTAVEFLKKELK